MKIYYPYPMRLSNGYSYMLSILQFLNSLADYYQVEILSLDSEHEIDEYFDRVLNLKRNKNLNVKTISNKFLFIKSNKIFFFRNIKKYLNSKTNEKICIYSRDFKQMRLCLKKFRRFENFLFIFEVHQILSENHISKGNLKAGKEMYKLEKFVFKNVDFLIPITKTLRSEIRKKFDISTNMELVLPVGFNKEFLKKNTFKKIYDVIYAGNFSRWKGLDILIKAIEIIKKKYFIDINVLLVGAREHERLELEQKCIDKDIIKNVEILNRVNHREILTFLRKSKIGVIPNRYIDDGAFYTSPLKLYEYLGVGLKIVVADLPSINSAIDSSLVYYFQPENPQKLAEKIIFALNDDSFCEQTLKEYAQSFTWESRAKNFNTFLNENITH